MYYGHEEEEVDGPRLPKLPLIENVQLPVRAFLNTLLRSSMNPELDSLKKSTPFADCPPASGVQY